MRGGLLALLALVWLTLGAQPVPAAVTPDEILDDPVLEQRARALGRQLRCLVCQNQSIDDSDADLAKDLRRIVRERLVAGDSDEEIIAYLTARYGDFILLRPPVRPATWALWVGPFVVLALGAIGVAVFLRHKRREDPAEVELSPEDRARLARLLEVDPRSADTP